jgi:hypothetical protein
VTERSSNYNFWPIEGEMIGKPVYFLDIYRLNRFTDSLKTPIGYVGYRYDSSFISFATYEISIANRHKVIKQNDSLVLDCRNYMNPYHNSYIKKNPGTRYSSDLIFFERGKIIKTSSLSLYNLKNWEQKILNRFRFIWIYQRENIISLFLSKFLAIIFTHNSENIELIIE